VSLRVLLGSGGSGCSRLSCSLLISSIADLKKSLSPRSGSFAGGGGGWSVLSGSSGPWYSA
jgi:hypothetical protein